MKLYLAHPILSRADIRDKELKFEERTGIELVNPFYDGDEVRFIRPLDEGKITLQEYAAHLNENGKWKEFVRGDLKAVERNDGVVAVIYRGTPTIGTSMEMWHAVELTWAGRPKPVYIVTNFPEHIWLRFVAEETGGFIVSTFTELEQRLSERANRGK